MRADVPVAAVADDRTTEATETDQPITLRVCVFCMLVFVCVRLADGEFGAILGYRGRITAKRRRAFEEKEVRNSPS